MHICQSLDRGIMGGEGTIREGEKIPRRPLPEFKEVEGGMLAGFKEHGLFGTALDDKNQYGPQGMMLLLFIVAAITGTVLKLMA